MFGLTWLGVNGIIILMVGPVSPGLALVFMLISIPVALVIHDKQGRINE